MLTNPNSLHDYLNLDSDLYNGIRDKFNALLDRYQKILDQSLSKSKDLGVILRLLPGVVVQNEIGMQGMADLYRIKPHLLHRLVKYPIEPLKMVARSHKFTMDRYLSGFLKD